MVNFQTEYIAFLRGINVGGHKIIKMTELAGLFQSMGFTDVKTYIQSGNVLFSSGENEEGKLVSTIERRMESVLGYKVSVILRTTRYLRDMIKDSPFSGKTAGKETKFYVTFYQGTLISKISLPYRSPKDDFEILEVRNREAYSISILMPDGSYGNVGTMIEKLFGQTGTTRNWNTIVKMV